MLDETATFPIVAPLSNSLPKGAREQYIENQPSPLPSPIGGGVYSNVIAHLLRNLEFVIKRSRNKCAMTGFNIQSLSRKWRGKSPSLFTLHTSLKKRAAFTLAEVLITLGIIGVVAAMTMPALITNYKYMVLQNQLKTAYSDLNQAAKMFQVHNGMSMSEYASGVRPELAMREFQKEFNIVKKSDLVWDSTDNEGNNIGAAPYKWTDITGTRTAVSNCDTAGFFWDTQGRVLSIDDSPQLGENGPKVCIDINGEKAPNRLGVDFFIFMFTTDGYVIPWGQEHKNNPSCTSHTNNCSIIPEDYCKYAAKTQLSCAVYALSNQHPADSNKDYWHDFVRGR